MRDRITAFIIAMLLALLAPRCTADKLARVCPSQCFDGGKSQIGKGVCRAGVPVCDDDFNVIECVGQVTATPEVCDGVDNDCDGRIDQRSDGRALFVYPSPCELKTGVCTGAPYKCKGGEWVCDYGPRYSEIEQCDGVDNNCNGITDEDFTISDVGIDYGPSPYCYTGRAGSEFNSPCHPGRFACEGGTTVCINETTPAAHDLKCDSVDNDCNGIIDDPDLTITDAVDIVVGIDLSGSMQNTIGAVVMALQNFAETYSDPIYQFALVAMTPNEDGDLPHLILDLADFQTFIDTLSLTADGGGQEAAIDAIAYTCDNILNISFRSGARLLYVGFTDEPGASYQTPPINASEAILACQNAGLEVYHFSNDFAQFGPICTDTGGKHYDLSDDPYDLISDLNEILNAITCQN